jgi:hypothetical protein
LRFLLACGADGLAGEASDEEIDSLDGSPVNGGDVSISGNIGPVVPEDVLAEGVPLHLPATVPTCSLKAEVDASDPGKEGAERVAHT